MKFGIYRLNEPLEKRDLASLEKAYGTGIQIISVYRAWNRCSIDDDLHWLKSLRTSSRQILLTWEPWKIPANTKKPYDQPAFALGNILSGRYDDYIRSFARELTAFPRPVLLRVMHEMNGNWYPWCGTVNGNSPDEFIDAWHHIRDVANSEALSRILWVWSPYAQSYPPDPFNKMEDYFPGDEVVDRVAIDGYNWGQTSHVSVWQSFEEIYSDAYKTAISLSKHPIIIGETASTEIGGSKGLWIIDAFNNVKQRFPRIEALIWFDVQKECDWRIASSPESLKAFRTSAKIFNHVSQ